ncbi:arabinan endo-1,5-alpha-L-arabinosidase [Pseudotamlana carrageenivorans]|uniref:Arabinan endo-1,5-alpha-L-arabinosidase n=1 Tax=Pseudotamlana carrageenivorans TaxID=2069432 RepID=A0A2I7SLT1_9FLAO|nr:arabinan endo-1,5-alpha-L-arabinosidase [Tamlana carrageenivorans]AUS06879.1 arabinan endo-1,5-alpha-L-arabinosidase [Tamlana carrageenivorans]
MKKHNYFNGIKSFALTALVIFLSACSGDDNIDDSSETPKPDPEPEVEVPVPESFDGPTYADDYSSMASWANRSKWNLANVHDPTVVKHGDYYYMYQTDASYGNAHDGHGHFHGRRSKDLVNWEYMGASMPNQPSWIKEELNTIRASYNLAPIENLQIGYWAPVVRKVGNVYRMYYSIVVDNFIGNGLPNSAANFDNTWTERAFIGMMETTDPSVNSSWEDKGMVVCSVSDKGNDWSRSSYTNDWNGYFKYNAIDPSYVITPEGEHWMFYGSWHSGIAAIQINESTGKPLNTFDYKDEATWGTHIYTRTSGSRWQGSEGPEVIYNENTGYYYLFLAYDGLDVPYNTRVCRSENVTGPYKGIDGMNVTNGGDVYPIVTHPYKFNNHSGWVGFAHNAMFQNEETGDWFYSSQARLPENTGGNMYSNAIMMGHVREVSWTSDGWPVVSPERFANVPQTEITEENIVGTWEQITMNYEYRVMQTSKTIIFSKDGTLGGEVSGSWELNKQTNTIYINGDECKLFNAWDWEAAPRKLTIAYSGLTTDGKPIWAKKK